MISEFLLAVHDILGLYFHLKVQTSTISHIHNTRVYHLVYGRDVDLQLDIVDIRHQWIAVFSVSIIPDVPLVVDNQIIGQYWFEDRDFFNCLKHVFCDFAL